MSRKGKTRPRTPPEPAAWDFGGAFGASLQAWNRRDEVPGEGTDPPGDALPPDHPRVISSRTRGVWHEL
jgi:hypothetical protein